MGEDNSELEKRKEKAIKFLKDYKNYIQYLILAAIIWLSYKIRTANLPFLKDVTTGKYIPADPDALGILRYVIYVLEHGKLMAIDTLRYHPLGFTGMNEFNVLSHFIVYLYKFMHFFNPKISNLCIVFIHASSNANALASSKTGFPFAMLRQCPISWPIVSITMSSGFCLTKTLEKSSMCILFKANP